LETAQFVHGEDGMGDLGLELQGRHPEAGDAIEVIINTVHKFPRQIELVTLGPLTNIAAAIMKDPTIVAKIKQCTIMGGVGIGHGNITPVSEYNIWTDPEAAKIVFESGMKIKMVGWDISRNHAWVDKAEADRIKALDTPLAHFAVDVQKKVSSFAIGTSKLPGFDLPDPIAMAIALDPSVATITKNLCVEVILSEGVTRGQTVVDHTGVLQKEPNIEVVLEASRETFLSMLHSALK
ncbi:MAG: nucleoside hydrolase, partial [Cyclobacteriaceae bacterium]